MMDWTGRTVILAIKVQVVQHTVAKRKAPRAKARETRPRKTGM